MSVKALHEKRMGLVTQVRGILEKAEKEGRANLTQDETETYEKLIKEQDEIRVAIERQQKADDLIAEMNSIPSSQKAADPRATHGEPVHGTFRGSDKFKSEFRNWMKWGAESLSPETRALSAGVLSEGGAMVPPEQFVTDLIKAIDDQVAIRRLATVYSVTSAASLGAPSLENDPADANWTSELATGSEDSTMSFGKRSLIPHPLAKRIKVSQSLIQNSALPVESIVSQRLAYKFAISEEKAFLSGNGAGQPLGVFTASASGVSTARDVQTGSASGFTFDGLIDAKFALKEGYLPRANWLFHRDALKLIAKLKNTTTNEYLWQPNAQLGRPDVLLGVPVILSEYAPNTFTSGLYVGMIADFSYYWIAQNLSMTMQRLVELYAETNQIGFIGRMQVDGMPVMEGAFSRLKTN